MFWNNFKHLFVWKVIKTFISFWGFFIALDLGCIYIFHCLGSHAGVIFIYLANMCFFQSAYQNYLLTSLQYYHLRMILGQPQIWRRLSMRQGGFRERRGASLFDGARLRRGER